MQNQSRNQPNPQSAVLKTLKTFLIVCALTAALAVLLFALLVALLSITEYRPRDVENAIVISDVQNGETGAPYAASAVSDAGQKNPARLWMRDKACALSAGISATVRSVQSRIFLWTAALWCVQKTKLQLKKT